MSALPLLVEYLLKFVATVQDVNSLPTLKETADFSAEVGIKRDAVSYMVRTGFIPAQKIQGRYFIQYRAMIDSFIKTHESGDIILNPINQTEISK